MPRRKALSGISPVQPAVAQNRFPFRALSAKPGSISAVVVGDTIVSQEGLAAILKRDKRYTVCGGAHEFFSAVELIRRHRPDILLIEPFLENRDALRWIEDLAEEYTATRILIVSGKSERIYAERALNAGAAGFWMKNGSAAELLCAVETIARGDIYVSPIINALAVQRLGKSGKSPGPLDSLSPRELAVFASIASGERVGQIAKHFGISSKTVESHCRNIKQKMGYENAESLRRGARELLS